ncbi:MAG: phosphate ABC transporter permease PstA [Candidatus Eisenbacteria bacterium]|nr:phosphate ABC transporter permease PstA [Candidatus Eisenbacteria bacterium]
MEAAPRATRPRSGYWASGDAGIWLTAGATALCLLLILGVFALIVAGGLGFFWPRAVHEFTLADGTRVHGQIWEREPMPAGSHGPGGGTTSDAAGKPATAGRAERIEIKGANRDVDASREYFWVPAAEITARTTPRELIQVERLEYGEAYGMPVAYRWAGGEAGGGAGGGAGGEATGGAAFAKLNERWGEIERLRRQVSRLERKVIGEINRELESVRAELGSAAAPVGPKRDALSERARRLEQRYAAAEEELTALRTRLDAESLILATPSGAEISVPAGGIVRFFRPNELDLWGKVRVYADRMWEFVSGTPREANTQGGILPAIFGTVLMVFLMTLAVVPLGVIAALYLREYARQGTMVQAVRIAVNNLAGVPSIVFGIFGLGFFVYFVGGSIDRAFFADRLPTPTYGTGGILWSALTLALLTLPVVIVATEEGLAAVPRAAREGSLALGATKWETTWRVVLPAASPGILTGVILAMARAAGEVAPLMLTGAVKIANDLPLSGEFPFLHLERKFMHLGFHIYDVGFQSPNVEAAKPMVYMTTLLLVTLVIALNLVAMAIRSRLRARVQSSHF